MEFGALQKKLGLNDTSSFELYFLDFENDKVRKKTVKFKLTTVKTV